MTRDQIKRATEAFLGLTIDDNDLSPCPYAGILHDAATGSRACRWTWNSADGMPHVKCLHAKCQDAWSEKIKELYRHLRAMQRAERGDAPARPYDPQNAPLPREPKKRPPSAPAFDPVAAERIAARCKLPEITPWMLRMASTVAIPDDPRLHGALLIDKLYRPGENILVFTRFASQGQYIHTSGAPKSWRLGSEPGVKAVESPHLPYEGPEGVWFLTAPVIGKWVPNPNKKDEHGNQLPGRRHAACCTRFPFLVLESDNLPPAVWLKILAQLEAPIAAIYGSGGKSIHALIAVNADTPQQFNLTREHYLRTLPRIGADWAAMTAVRLSRLPGCLRRGAKDKTGTWRPYDKPRLQELLYLNPSPDCTPLQELF